MFLGLKSQMKIIPDPLYSNSHILIDMSWQSHKAMGKDFSHPLVELI